MGWSLLNVDKAALVAALLDAVSRDAEPDFVPSMSRPIAEAVIHSVIWAYGVRQGSTASAYAYSNLFDALQLDTWTFKPTDETEAK